MLRVKFTSSSGFLGNKALRATSGLLRATGGLSAKKQWGGDRAEAEIRGT